MSDEVRQLPDPTPARVLATLSECAVDLADLRDPQLVLRAIVRRTRALLGTDMSYLSLNDLERGETHIAYTDGVATEAYRTIRMPLGTGVLGAVAAGGEDVQTRDYLADPAMTHLGPIDDIVRGEGVRAIHGCPIRAGGRVVAALLVAHRSPIRFSRRQIATLRRMAETAAVALELERLRGGGLDDVLLQFHDDLTARILAGPEAVLELLSERIGTAVELHEGDTETLVASVPAPLRPTLRTALSTSLHTGSVVGVGPELTVLTARLGDEPVATVVVRAPAEVLGERGRQLVARAGPAIATAAESQRRLISAESREQTDLLDELVRAELTPELLARTAALGFVRRRPVLVVAVEGAARAPLVRAAHRLTPRALLTSSHAGHQCLVVQLDDATAAVGALHAALAPARLGWSRAEGLATVGQAHRTAQRCLAALGALGVDDGAADPAALGLAGLLTAEADPTLVSALVSDRIGPLLRADAERGSDLARTAATLLDCGGSLVETGRRLHLHPNTVRQRSERIGALIGSDWRDPARSVDLHFALRLWQVQVALEG